jgi:hypothetical protein
MYIDHLQDSINRLSDINSRLQSGESNQDQVRLNESCIEQYQDEIFDIELLRDGLITKEQLGTARRFFNKVPDGFTYGT